MKELLSCKVESNAYAKDQIQTVQKDLVFLRSFLESIVEQRSLDEKLQSLWNRVTEFVIDSLLVGDTTYSSATLLSSIREEIKHIKTEALKIYDGKKFGFKAHNLANTPTPMRSKGSFRNSNEVVAGLDDEARIIIDQLTRGSTQLDVVSIVGMPGLGNTTLAKKVYNDPSIICQFHIRAWCCISQVYRTKDIFLEILDCIVLELSDEYFAMNEDDLGEKLYRCLKGNRYLIILDDVWDKDAWNGLERSFTNDGNGSTVLLTSRLHEVALQIKLDGRPHPLRQLSYESWELLRKKLFPGQAFPQELCDLRIQIAKNCNGLPLSVVIIAGILATMEQDGWEAVAEGLSSDIVCGTEHCMNILEMSYKYLPDCLKPCFL